MNRKYQKDRKNKNVLHMPNLTNKILNKALDSLNNTKYSEAKSLFLQMLNLNEEQEQALYGLAICLIELREFDDAEVLTNDMLEKGLGNYFDVLRLYITVLIQTSQFDKAASFLKGLLDEIDMTPDQRKTYEDLLVFCMERQNLCSEDLSEIPMEDPDISKKLSLLYNADSVMERWQAVTGLVGLDVDVTQSALSPLLMKGNVDSFSKTLMLKVLSENGYTGEIEMEKANHIYKINLDGLFDPVTSTSKEISALISERLLSENPTLCEQVLDVWEHFSYASYPLDLSVSASVHWAAACTYYVYQLNGFVNEADKINALFNIDLEVYQSEYTIIHRIEAESALSD